jgi:hypothetical protein
MGVDGIGDVVRLRQDQEPTRALSRAFSKSWAFMASSASSSRKMARSSAVRWSNATLICTRCISTVLFGARFRARVAATRTPTDPRGRRGPRARRQTDHALPPPPRRARPRRARRARSRAKPRRVRALSARWTTMAPRPATAAHERARVRQAAVRVARQLHVARCHPRRGRRRRRTRGARSATS